MAVVPAPWATLPPRWAVDDLVLATRLPTMPDLVRALSADEERGGDLQVCLAFTRPADADRLLRHILDRGGAAPGIDLFADAADALTAAGTGWLRWEAQYVWRETLGAWPIIDGDHLGRGVDLTALDAGRATSTVFAWWHRRLSQGGDDWKQWVKAMRREPRRVVRKLRNVPMTADAVSELQGLIGSARGARST